MIAVTYLVLSLVVTAAEKHYRLHVADSVSPGDRVLRLLLRRRPTWRFTSGGIAARSLSSTVEEITHHFYLAIGFTSVVADAAAVDDVVQRAPFDFSADRNGSCCTGWRTSSAGLGCWHYYLQAKADKSRPEIYIGVLGVSAVVAGRRGSVVYFVPSAERSRNRPQQPLVSFGTGAAS